MSFYSTILFVVAMGILVVSLIYTYYLAKQQKLLQGELDTKIPEAVQEHIYLKNPIFLAYALFFALVIFIIVFVATNSTWL